MTIITYNFKMIIIDIHLIKKKIQCNYKMYYLIDKLFLIYYFNKSNIIQLSARLLALSKHKIEFFILFKMFSPVL